jgi:hypothetical protein
MRAEITTQVEKMRHQQDAIMKKFSEAETKIQEAGKDAETVFEIEMEMIRNFHLRSKSPSSLPRSREKSCTTGVLAAGWRGGKMPPPPNPPPGHTAPKDQPPQPKRDGYVDFFRRALQCLSGDTPANREMGVVIANQALELEKARPKKQASLDRFQSIVKRLTRKTPKEFDGKLDSDFTSWKMDLEIYVKYYKQEFAKNRIESLGWGVSLKEMHNNGIRLGLSA